MHNTSFEKGAFSVRQLGRWMAAPSMRHYLLAALALAFSGSLLAAPLPEVVRTEVTALLDRLEASGCEFNRNGSWYSGKKAKSHLERKLDYLEKKGTVSSSEQFIELAASASSFTGKPYQVKCGDSSAVPSKEWLTEELAKVRAEQTTGSTIPSSPSRPSIER